VLRTSLGHAGQRYVERFHWPTILDEFEELLEATIRHHTDRAGVRPPSAVQGATC
jgi:hypothetical protein